MLLILAVSSYCCASISCSIMCAGTRDLMDQRTRWFIGEIEAWKCPQSRATKTYRHYLVTLRRIGLNSVQQTKLETRVWVLLYYCLCAEQPEQLLLNMMVCSFRPAMVIIRMPALDIYEQGHVGIEWLQREPFHSSRFLVTWPPGPCLYEFNVGSKRHKHSKYRQRPSRTGRSDAW